jgi:hypothetical protein
MDQTNDEPDDFAVCLRNQAHGVRVLQKVGYVFLAKSFYGKAFSLNLVKLF